MDLFAELEPAKEVLSLLITQCFEAFSWQVIRALISLVSSGKPLWLMWISVHQNHSAALVKNAMHLLEMFVDILLGHNHSTLTALALLLLI